MRETGYMYWYMKQRGYPDLDFHVDVYNHIQNVQVDIHLR